MKKALRAKCLQHADLREQLLATRQLCLEEASPYDSYWGTSHELLR